MRGLIACLLAAAVPAQMATAQQSCFSRSYSEAHLAANPAQTVARMTVLFEGLAEGPGSLGTGADADVRFRDDDRRWTAGFYCPPEARNGTLCAIDCDGGSFTVSWKDRDTILLRTAGFVVGVHCDAEDPVFRNVRDTGAGQTVFLLRRVPMDACPRDWVQ